MAWNSLIQALFFNVLGAIFSSRRLPPFEFLAKILEFFSVFLEFFQVSLRFFYRFGWFKKKSSICMLFLNFFLPAALLSNQRGFWKSKNIPIFAIYGYNVSQSMSSGHTLRMYSFLEGYWNCALASSFFLILRKAAPSLSFWTKIGLSFCPKGKFWVFLALEFSQKCWKKAWSNEKNYDII